VIVQHVIDLDSRGFPPRLAAVADMANSLRAERRIDRAAAGRQVPFPDIAPEAPYSFSPRVGVVGHTPVHSSVPVSNQRLGPDNSDNNDSLYGPLALDAFRYIGSYRGSNAGGQNAENVLEDVRRV
jgi:hypothetical protein